MKKGFIIFLNILLIFLISSCDKLVKYENEVTYVEFMEAFKEEFNKNGEEERPCCGGHCHCNHDADGDHVCHCHEEVEPEFDLENKDEE